MRLTRALFLALSLLFLSGCIASQKNINLDMQNLAKAPDDDILCLIKPADGPIFSEYGKLRRIRSKTPKIHAGIDISAKRGSDVVAAAGGTVTFSGRKNGYGNTVIIDHGKDRSTLYAHMDTVFVIQGQIVAQGERLGLVGRTGRTTGPHLHFELLLAGKHTNPVPEGGWSEPDFNILTAAGPAKASPPTVGPVAGAAGAVAPTIPAGAGANAAADGATTAEEAKPGNPILAFFRKLRPVNAGQEDDPLKPAS